MTKISTTGRCKRAMLAGMFLFTFWISAVHAAIAAGSQEDISLQGKLDVEKGPQALLQSEGKTVLLTSDSRSTLDTLSDSRLSGRELKVVGRFRKDGSFEVHEFFVIHGNNLYRVIYYCEVCHITAFSPGNCVCCQNPTVPVEVSPADPRIYHEEIKGPSKQPHQ